MVANLQHLQVFFREFTQDDQDLSSLKKLQTLELNCLGGVVGQEKYITFENRELLFTFSNEVEVDVMVKLNHFNVEMSILA